MNKWKIAKRIIALTLSVSLLMSYSAQSLAETQGVRETSMVVKFPEEKSDTEILLEQAEESQLYQELAESNLQSRKAGDEASDYGDDWVKSYEQKVAEEGIKETLDEIGKAASNQSKHLWKGDSNSYWANKNLLTGTAKTIELYGAALNILDIASLFNDVLNLQGDTIEDQLLELAFLTMKFGIAAFATIGMTIGFPWGLLLGLTLDLLLDLARKGYLTDLLPNSWNTDPWGLENAQHYRLPTGTNVYKPNIYIYSGETRKVTVTFEQPELLTETIPQYGSAWEVTTGEDGLLTDADGTEYGYLFYESVTDPLLFQTERGWRISADTRQEQFETILTELGFNEQEIADFTEFWVKKLEPGTDYIMYPQDTETVDLAMPVTIEETPESVERIWFAFAEDEGQTVSAPTGCGLTRGGFGCGYYVIEWGGLILP